MKASGKLRIFIVICVLFVTRSEVRSKKPLLTSRLNIEEGDGGSGDPVRKVIEKNVIPPDDTEASGGESDDDEDNDGGSGSGMGSGSGARPTNMTVKPTTIQTVVVINPGDGSTTASTTIVDITTKKSIITEIDNNVDPSSNQRKNQTGNTVIVDNEIPDVAQSTREDIVDDSALANSGVNFTVAIIVGVVVGAILSILIIVFLVYRLRKKDEGSYSLDEQSSAMLRADTDSPPPKGKEEYYA